ncbi:hypothetical protein MMC09_007007 [Bachmanniomyces sp. S44760]|nr:hypothetical protein [Bachmanniomyces sp. S44760]
MNFINIGLRSVQIFFAVIILGLSGHLVATQVFGGAPSQTNFTVFLGIWGLVIGLLGIVASFVGALQGLVMLGLDVFGCLLNFAGGIALAVALGTNSCSCYNANTACDYLLNNSIINGGKNDKGQVDLDTNRVNRCHEAKAATAFVFFELATFIATAALSGLEWRKKR